MPIPVETPRLRHLLQGLPVARESSQSLAPQLDGCVRVRDLVEDSRVTDDQNGKPGQQRETDPDPVDLGLSPQRRE